MKMSLKIAVLLALLFLSNATSEECDTKAEIKTWQMHSQCPRRAENGDFVGYGYNINHPNANDDFALIGIDHVDLRKGLVQKPGNCNCEENFCLTMEQSERLFQIRIDRAQKEVEKVIRTSDHQLQCCNIRNSLTALVYTYGLELINKVPNAMSHTSNGQWKKFASALLIQSWCTSTDYCTSLAERIATGCNDVSNQLGCSNPKPKACDASGLYCCAENNTCCQYSGK